jgi:YrhK-like protein
VTSSRTKWWAPNRTGWWIAALFIVGSACFALGALPLYASSVGARADGVTYFVGSLFFTSAAALQVLVATGAVPAAGHHPLASVQWRALRRAPDRAEWWAGVVQFAGTLLFNVSTFAALQDALNATEADRRVWTPDALGSIAFLVASALAFADVRRPWLSWRPRDLGWSIATVNLAGSVAFGISAVASYVVPSTDDMRDVQRVNLGTFVGALCFLIGAVLLIPGQLAPATTPRTQSTSRPASATG